MQNQRACRCQTHGNWGSDHAAQRAIESVLGGEFPAAPRRELIVNARPAMGQRAKRGLCGEFAAANGKPQSVAGHRIDKAGGVAGEHQAVRQRRPGGIDGERTDDRWGGQTNRARANRSRSDAIAGQRLLYRAERVAQIGISWPPRASPRHTLVNPFGNGATPR